jgi:hypothetical protein
VQSAWNKAGAGLLLKFSPRDVAAAGASPWALAAGTPHRQSMATVAATPNPNAPLVGRIVTGNQTSLPAENAGTSRESRCLTHNRAKVRPWREIVPRIAVMLGFWSNNVPSEASSACSADLDRLWGGERYQVR